MIPAICPYCSTNFRLPDSQAGLKVKCKVCDATFAVPDRPEDDVPVLEEAEPARRGSSRVKETRDEQRPRDEPPRPRSTASRSRDDEDDRPIRRRSRDDDEDEAPRGGGLALVIILGIVGVTVLLVGGGIALAYAFSGSPKPAPAPAPAPMPVPAPNPPGPGPAPVPMPMPPEPPKTPQTIDEALAALRADSTRRDGLEFFRKTKPDAARQDEVARALVALLTEPGVGRQAGEVLNEWATPVILDDVGRIAADNSPITSRRAMAVLVKLADDERAVPVLGRLFVAPRKASAAAPLLAKAGKKAESVVLPHLNHKDRDVQREADTLLLGYGTSEAKLREQTIKDLGSDDKDVQRNALRRLAKYRPDPDAKDEQARAARAIEPMLKDFFIRTDAYAAMDVWATKDSVPALIAALDEIGAPPGAVVRILTRLKDESAIEPLAAHFVKRGNLNEMVKTLSAFGPPAEATALKLLDERNPLVRRAGLSTLEEVGGKKALDVLSNPKVTAALRKADPGAATLIASVVAKIKARMK